MPFDALSAKASEIVPVGAIDSRWLLRMPCARIAALIVSGRREANRGAARYCSTSSSGNAPFSLRDLHRRRVRGVAHRLGDARGHRAALGGVVAQVELDQRVAEAGEAQPDAALGHRLLLLLRQRPGGHLEHVVQHPHAPPRPCRRSRRSRTARSGVNGASTKRVRSTLPRSQQPYAGSGCSPQLCTTRPLASNAWTSATVTSKTSSMPSSSSAATVADETLAVEVAPVGGEQRTRGVPTSRYRRIRRDRRTPGGSRR